MRHHHRVLSLLAGLVVVACAPASVATNSTPTPGHLSDADRARQLLNRFTFGARASDVAEVQRIGERAWLDRQLAPERIIDRGADSVLDLLDITHKTGFELAADHPNAFEFIANPARLLAMIKDTAQVQMQSKADSAPMSAVGQLMSMRSEIAKNEREVDRVGKLGSLRQAAIRELAPSMLIRASKSDRQLLEVMTVFWENHFSVSSQQMIGQFTLVDYDHTIREHALGKFRDLLGAVAMSPAMLFYLDNYTSRVDSMHPTQIEWRIEQRRAAHPPLGDTSLVHAVNRRRTGLNENYARELMELHTLGVDGGYTQKDVQEVARALTGWSIDNMLSGSAFEFTAATHDAGEKTVLGVRMPGGRGIEDGQQVLDILARHPSTAHFIARKLVVHFVSDDPPAALVDRVAQTYLRTDGDIREMLRTIASSPEFNSPAAYRAKVKTPFELVASMLRVMDAKPDTTQQSVAIVTRLGQPIFGRTTPDGWPDQASAWMNSGGLMNRVTLAQQVGGDQLPTLSARQWKAARQLDSAPAEQQVDGVINLLLAGLASPETKKAMNAIAPSPIPMQRIAALATIALGSADFQRR
ncbi:MAG TPA: DUF1800 domain-containing protein [Gemmatimonadaceae bacterium]|jgi:uncharacterized protein (DUF1800 family)